MDRTANRSSLSRRNLLRTSAAGAVAGTIATGAGVAVAGSGGRRASAAAPPVTDVAVTATVVRASHGPAADGTLRLGVRTAVRSGGQIQDGHVIVVDGIDFFASQDEIHAAIIGQVRDTVARRLAKQGSPVAAEDITVRVFGGLW